MMLWIVLAAMTAVALAMVLTPLFRRPNEVLRRGDFDATIYREQIAEIERERERGLLDRDQAQAARTEIGRRLLATRAEPETAPASEAADGGFRFAAVAVGIGIPLGAMAFYLVLGAPNLATGDGAAVPRQAATDSAGPDIAAMVARLGARLKQQPDDGVGWALYARSLAGLGRFAEAVTAFRRAISLDTANVELHSRYAEALIFADEGTVTPAAFKAIEATLALDPGEARARYYLGLADSQAGRREAALKRWQALETESTADAPWLPALRQRIAKLAGEMGIDAAALAALSPKAAMRPPPSALRGPSAADVTAAQQMSSGDRSAMIRTMVDRLAERLKGAPDDLAGWRRLARSYGVLGEADKARAARAHVARLERKSAGGSSAMGKPAARTPSAPGRRESFAVATKAFDGGDYATAFETWRRLAAAGDAEAQTAIAGMYRRGEGRKVNLTAAAAWYRRAAQQGEAVAQMNLGEMYRLGQGVARDKAQAYVWFTLAATGGKTWAAAELQKLTGTMTVDEITRAAGLLRDQSLQIPAK